MEIKKLIGRNICAERNRKGLSQEELANRLGFDRKTIFNWEDGASMPDAISIYKMSVILSCKADAFYVGLNTTECDN